MPQLIEISDVGGLGRTRRKKRKRSKMSKRSKRARRLAKRRPRTKSGQFKKMPKRKRRVMRVKPKKRRTKKRRVMKVKVKRRKSSMGQASRRGEVKLRSASKKQIRQLAALIKRAKMSKAVSAIRLSLIALATGKWAAAGNLAITAAVNATAAHRQNPAMAARIVMSARAIVRKAIKKIRSRSA